MAIISVEGVILESEDGFVKRQIDRAMKDENVKAVVLRGRFARRHRQRQRLHLPPPPPPGREREAQGSDRGQHGRHRGQRRLLRVDGRRRHARHIFAEPTSFTGSIGVIIPHYNLAGLMEKIGAKEDSIASDPLKDMGSLARP